MAEKILEVLNKLIGLQSGWLTGLFFKKSQNETRKRLSHELLTLLLAANLEWAEVKLEWTPDYADRELRLILDDSLIVLECFKGPTDSLSGWLITYSLVARRAGRDILSIRYNVLEQSDGSIEFLVKEAIGNSSWPKEIGLLMEKILLEAKILESE